MISSLLNDTLLYRSIESLRLLFRFYFFYLAVCWLEPDVTFLKKINLLILLLLLLEFPVIIFRFLQYGIHEEAMGAWERSGSVTATLWFSGIFYCASFFFIYKPKKYFIILALGFVTASILGAKRIVLFLYPLQFLAIYFYIYLKEKRISFSKKLLSFSIIIFFITIVSGSILYFNKSLSPGEQIGEQIDLSYALEYAQRYNEGITADGYSFGRKATTERVFKILADSGVSHLFLGVGPGVTTPSFLDNNQIRRKVKERFEEFKIQYGLTTMSRIALEFGIFGVIAYTWMLAVFSIRCWKLYTQESDPYWKAFAGGSFGFSISMLFFFFFYGHNAFWGDTMPPLYFYAMAVIYIRYQYHRNPAYKSQLYHV